jgi:hypothetical protein
MHSVGGCGAIRKERRGHPEKQFLAKHGVGLPLDTSSSFFPLGDEGIRGGDAQIETDELLVLGSPRGIGIWGVTMACSVAHRATHGSDGFQFCHAVEREGHGFSSWKSARAVLA